MKFNAIMPECYIDTTLVQSLLDAKVCHKYGCNVVAKEMEKGHFKDAFAVGIIDNDKRKIPYIEGFDVIGRTENLVFLKHKSKHHYVIKVGKDSKAIETFLKANVEAVGKRMEDFDLSSDLDELTLQTKNSVSTQKDPRILNLIKTVRLSPEVVILRNVLSYLAENNYNADIDRLKQIINK